MRYRLLLSSLLILPVAFLLTNCNFKRRPDVTNTFIAFAKQHASTDQLFDQPIDFTDPTLYPDNAGEDPTMINAVNTALNSNHDLLLTAWLFSLIDDFISADLALYFAIEVCEVTLLIDDENAFSFQMHCYVNGETLIGNVDYTVTVYFATNGTIDHTQWTCESDIAKFCTEVTESNFQLVSANSLNLIPSSDDYFLGKELALFYEVSSTKSGWLDGHRFFILPTLNFTNCIFPFLI